MTGAEGRVTGAEGRVAGAEGRVTGAEGRVTGAEGRVAGSGERSGRMYVGRGQTDARTTDVTAASLTSQATDLPSVRRKLQTRLNLIGMYETGDQRGT